MIRFIPDFKKAYSGKEWFFPGWPAVILGGLTRGNLIWSNSFASPQHENGTEMASRNPGHKDMNLLRG